MLQTFLAILSMVFTPVKIFFMICGSLVMSAFVLTFGWEIILVVSGFSIASIFAIIGLLLISTIVYFSIKLFNRFFYY